MLAIAHTTTWVKFFKGKYFKGILWMVIQYCLSAIPSYYVFLNGTALHCINIIFERQEIFDE